MKLRVCIQSMYDKGITSHPIDIINRLKIKYNEATFHFAQFYIFHECLNVPDELPSYIKVIQD